MKKVLLINPIKDALARDKHILDRDDLLIFTATTAEEGLRIHREEKVNLILTELDLPEIGGDVLCSRIRQEQGLQMVSVIVVCRDIPEEIERAESCGANAWLLKPVKPEQLNDCIGKLLDVPTRQGCRVLVRAQVYGESGATTMFGTSLNISVSGLLLDSDGVLTVGDRISCMFFLPGAKQITTIGEVVRVARQSRMTTQYAIKFIHLYPEVQTEIESFVGAINQAAWTLSGGRTA